jgi:hypothetical protein
MFQNTTPSMIEAYQEFLLDEAKNNPLPVSTVPVGSRFRDRVGKRLGNLLISIGLKLRERYEPATYPAPETYPSTAGKASI